MTVRAEIRPKMGTHTAFLLWMVAGYALGVMVAEGGLPWWANLLVGLGLGIACGEHAYRRDKK